MRFVFPNRQAAVASQHKYAYDLALRLPVAHTLLDIRPLLLAQQSAERTILAQPVAPAHALTKSSTRHIMRWRTIVPIARLDALLIAGGQGVPLRLAREALHEVRELIDQLAAEHAELGVRRADVDHPGDAA